MAAKTSIHARSNSFSTATEADIRDFCRDQIAPYKVPRHIRFVTEFPLTVTGKVQKFLMREQMSTELAARADPTA